MKHTYTVETTHHGKTVRLFSDSRDFCLGYLKRVWQSSPRNEFKLRRSDGVVIAHAPACTDVDIGMVAGWPTAEQYEAAAKVALDRAANIRAQEARTALRRAAESGEKESC